MRNGDWLTLGAISVLALAGSARKHGSFQKLSRNQQALLKLKNQLKNPEATIRALDFIISSNPGYPEEDMNGQDPPGVWDKSANLLNAYKTFSRNPEATLDDYQKLLVMGVRNNNYLEPFGASIDLEPDWTFTKQIGWIGIQIARLVRLKQKGRMTEGELLGQISEMKRGLSKVFDWVYATRPNLTQYNFAQAEHESDTWHNQARQQVKAAKISRLKKQGKWNDCPGGIAILKGTDPFVFGNGWTIQNLTTSAQLLEEGNLSWGAGCLKHCIGEGDYYKQDLAAGRIKIYSLRSPLNRPFVSITVNPQQSTITQAKGLFNRTAGAFTGNHNLELMKRLDDEFPSIEEYLDLECVMISLWAKQMGYTWSNDASPCRVRLGRLSDLSLRKPPDEIYPFGSTGLVRLTDSLRPWPGHMRQRK